MRDEPGDDIDALPLTDVEKQRIRMTVGCHDCDAIPKVADAGEVHDGPLGRFQVMHNGVKIVEHCYTGPWSTELIRRLRGTTSRRRSWPSTSSCSGPRRARR